MTESLEADIKKYTEQLAADPKSRAFVPLADIYRKLGRYEEAIAVAQEGLNHHPHYVGAKMALARAYFEDGSLDEAGELLESVIQFAPDNLFANRLLSQIYVQKGTPEKAVPLLRQLLTMEPNDSRAATQLAQIEAAASTGTGSTPPVAEPAVSPQPSPPAAAVGATPPPASPPPAQPVAATASSVQPGIKSATMANLYRSQGHLTEALAMYEELLTAEPQNKAYSTAIEEIKRELTNRGEVARSGDGRGVFLKTLLERIQTRRRADL